MRTPGVEDALWVLRQAARQAVEEGADPAAVAWEATAAAVDARAGRDATAPTSPDARQAAVRAANAVGWATVDT